MKSSEELKLKAAADIWRRTKINFTLKRNWKLKEIPEANFRFVQTGPWRKPSDIKTGQQTFCSEALSTRSPTLPPPLCFQSLFACEKNSNHFSEIQSEIQRQSTLYQINGSYLGIWQTQKKMSFFFPLCSQKLQKYKTQFLAKHFQSSLFICPL